MDFELPETPDEDEEDVVPFASLGIDTPEHVVHSDGTPSPAKDALDALLDDDPDFDDDELESPMAEDNFFAETNDAKSESPDSKDKNSDNGQNEDGALETYQLLLETVWVDDVLDPAEVALLARKREALGISFEQHLEVVRSIILEDVE